MAENRDLSFAGIHPYEGDYLFLVGGFHNLQRNGLGVTMIEPLIISAKDKKEAEFLFVRSIGDSLKEKGFKNPYSIEVTINDRIKQEQVYSKNHFPAMELKDRNYLS